MGAFLTIHDYESLKKAAAAELPGVKSSHRAEAIARGLGSGSVAALLTKLSGEARSADLRADLFSAYLSDHGLATHRRTFAAIVAAAGTLDDATKGGVRIGAVIHEEGGLTPFVWVMGLGWARCPEAEATAPDAIRSRLRSTRFTATDLAGCDRPDDPLSRAMLKREGPIVDVLPDGSIAAMRYVGMGHWLWDFGPADLDPDAALLLANGKKESHGNTVKIVAPWSPTQVELLRRHQDRRDIHPYTCPGDRGCGDRNLRPTTDGWICSCGEYRQDWARIAIPG